jgi:hypothetical protein
VLSGLAAWPDHSPGAANAWLLMVTTKPPTWKDQLATWPDDPPSLGDPHPGFFYPDPLGFWAEVRRWVPIVFGAAGAAWVGADALALSALVNVGDDPSRLTWVRDRTRPRIVLFLDEASWNAARPATGELVRSSVADPHRPGQAYEGWWGREGDTAVGKAPQHPSTHRLYDSSGMDAYLRSLPALLEQGPAA